MRPRHPKTLELMAAMVAEWNKGRVTLKQLAEMFGLASRGVAGRLISQARHDGMTVLGKARSAPRRPARFTCCTPGCSNGTYLRRKYCSAECRGDVTQNKPLRQSVWELRLQRGSYRSIARKCGVSSGRVRVLCLAMVAQGQLPSGIYGERRA